MIARVVALAITVLVTSAAGFFFYLLVVSITGRRRLREPFTRQQLSIDLFFLSGGLGFSAYAMLFAMISQDSHYIAMPTEVAQWLKVAMVVLGASSGAISICAAAILLADHFLHPPDRAI